MNTTEQIVESYYRICHECFTVPDVKVKYAYSRQFDLLAYSLRDQKQFHIEVSVSHVRQFAPKAKQLLTKLEQKFLGLPSNRESSSQPENETFIRNIHSTYMLFGMRPSQVQRVWVCWERPKEEDFDQMLSELMAKYEQADNPIQIVSFKHTIIPALKRRIKTAHYDDVALRTISLFNQGRKQVNVDKERRRQRDIRNGGEDD